MDKNLCLTLLAECECVPILEDSLYFFPYHYQLAHVSLSFLTIDLCKPYLSDCPDLQAPLQRG